MADQGEIVAEAPPDGADSLPVVVRSGRRGWSVRKMMIAVAVAGVGLFLLRPVYVLVDALNHGPLTRAYNRECRHLADDAHLVGKAEADVVKVLGEPLETWEYDQPKGRTKTFAYSPSPVLGLFNGSATFQVHCRGGVVQAVGVVAD